MVKLAGGMFFDLLYYMYVWESRLASLRAEMFQLPFGQDVSCACFLEKLEEFPPAFTFTFTRYCL